MLNLDVILLSKYQKNEKYSILYYMINNIIYNNI